MFFVNQDSWFWNAVPMLATVVFIAGLPPNESICTPLVPSSKSEFTRTRPAGRSRYGDP